MATPKKSTVTNRNTASLTKPSGSMLVRGGLESDELYLRILLEELTRHGIFSVRWLGICGQQGNCTQAPTFLSCVRASRGDLLFVIGPVRKLSPVTLHRGFCFPIFANIATDQRSLYSLALNADSRRGVGKRSQAVDTHTAAVRSVTAGALHIHACRSGSPAQARRRALLRSDG